MKNGITELVFILDRSGSMAGLEGDTIGGFNAMLEKQKGQSGECWVSTVLFDHETLVLHDRLPLEQVEPMTERDYQVRGSTALLDAVGGAIRHIGNIHRYARPEDVPENTLFIITTDGMENASRRYDAAGVRRMIGEKKARNGWEFIFMGANIDAVTTARRFGIDPARAVNYRADQRGTRKVYDAMDRAVCQIRKSGGLNDDWRRDADRDFKQKR